MRNRGAKLSEPDLRQPQIKAGVCIIRRELDDGAKVLKCLEIIPLAILDNTFGILQLCLFCGPPETRKQQSETAPEHTGTPGN